MAALADAADYREWRAQPVVRQCDAEPEGTCEDHLQDGALTGAYRALAASWPASCPSLPEEAVRHEGRAAGAVRPRR